MSMSKWLFWHTLIGTQILEECSEHSLEPLLDPVPGAPLLLTPSSSLDTHTGQCSQSSDHAPGHLAAEARAQREGTDPS